MSNLALVPTWHDNINMVDVTEPIVGGDGGNANLATRQLAESLLWLKARAQGFRVGDIYTTTIAHANAEAVAAHHGYGTWARYAEGRALVGFSTKSEHPESYKTMGAEFGSNTHTLTIAEMPSHSHKLGISTQTRVSHDDSQESDRPVDKTGGFEDGYIASSGGDTPHNNIQPSTVVGAWVRLT